MPSDKPAPDNGEEEFFIEMIRDLKTGVKTPRDIDVEQYKPVDDLETIFGELDELNKKISEQNGTEFKPIAGVIEFYVGKMNKFDDPRYERLFNIETKKSDKHHLSGSKQLDYGFREKLSGFSSSKGALKWSNERIDGFIHSIREANSQGEI